jgi:carbamoyltransferase
MDLAASIQAVTEEVVLRIAEDLRRRTRLRNLVMAGGVALNCVAGGRLLREGPFDGLWIQPAAGDAGGALGAALFVWHQLLERPRWPEPGDGQRGSLLGPAFAPEEVRRFLHRTEAPFRHFADEADLLDHVAGALDEGEVVGWFHGRMEFGPRALGARSILADARAADMQGKLNRKIKFREGFRPFAPAVLAEHAHEWFELPAGQESPYMLLVAPVHAEQRVNIPADQRRVMERDPDLCRRVGVVRSAIPAVTHVDFSARVQTVDGRRNPRFHRLLQAFHARTGCPVVVNTSFNVRGEPIVCTPQDAYRCFLATDMDVLVLEDFVLHKTALAGGDRLEAVRAEHLARFELD